MSKKATVTELKREYVVVRSMRRGLNCYHTFHGPFTKGEAGTYAMHFDRFDGGDCSVEHMAPVQHHEKWILRDANA